MNPKFLWIRTRDGSPTLWHNELGESYRSVKGAFTESWAAFVSPALERFKIWGEITAVGEFGLGAGTNWLLWQAALASEGRPSPPYFVIERDSEAFDMGLRKWAASFPLLERFLADRGRKFSAEQLERLLEKRPQIFPSLEAAQAERRGSAQIWFHDPFGFDVNPEGYSLETLESCAALWDAQRLWGGSYACNRAFRETLEKIPGLRVRVVPTGGEGLKRERLEFERL